ncbi:MAG: DUF349 domain-containing protein [Gammaproteobacteria bacterium]|nr:DUF349 domain-containing protein [Gammaproteobacteria bacterium]
MLRRMFKNRDRQPAAESPRGAAAGQAAEPAPPESAQRPAAAVSLDDIHDVSELIEHVVACRGAAREEALQHPLLKQAAALTALEKRSRGKDKALNRHARRLLEQRKSLHQQADAGQARAQELADALRRPPPPVPDHAWRERQHELHRRLTEALDHHLELGNALADFGEAPPSLEALRPDPADLPELDPAAVTGEADDPADVTPETAADAGNAAPGEPFEPLVAAFEALDQAMAAGAPFADVTAERQALTERWLASADRRPPTQAQHQVFEAVSHRFRELADAVERLEALELPALPPQPLDLSDTGAPRRHWDAVSQRRELLGRLEKARRHIAWPEWAPPAAGHAELAQHIDTLHSELEAADRMLREQLTALDGELDELDRAIDAGSLNEARSLLAAARKRHDDLPPTAVRDAGRRLGKAAARLAELKDWQTFATTPKRQSLLEAMQALAASPLPPRDQAERIKELRREWQALGPVTQAADGRLADRFNAEAEKAFEPCRAHFAELAEERKANLQQRQRICDELQRYLAETDWARADMAAAQQIMRAARDEWRRFHPVDRQPGRAVEEQFESLQAQLHARVKAEWDRNLQAKEAIVAEARALLEGDRPVQEKINAAKALQQRWRSVGITPRRPDQQLWQAFRSACDAVFAARDEEKHAEQAAAEALEQRLTAALDDFAGRLDSADSTAVSDAELREFRRQTADIEGLPPGRRRTLEQRRSELAGRYTKLLAEQRQSQARAQLWAVKRWDETVAEAEAAGSVAAPVAADPEADQAVSEDVAAARRRSAGQAVPLEALRRLTVRAELAAGRESPAEDEALRLEVQVERLQAGLSGAGRGEEKPDALADEWCRLGPKDAAAAPLRERFFDALAALD